MKAFGLDDFTTPFDDFEKRQYYVLAALHTRREEFIHSRLYPTLSDLVELKYALESTLSQRDKLSSNMPRQIRSVNWEQREINYEQTHEQHEDIERMFQLSEWALPLISEVIEEGRALYDFVEENISLEGVGIMPLQSAAGYFFVPEHRKRLLHILRFEVSLISREGGRYRAMRTNEVRQIRESRVTSAPEELKMKLVAEERDLPNPATFVCETDLDFPYTETMLPVVKRKLMAQLAS